MPSLAPGSQLPLVVGKNNPSARYSNNTQDDSQPGLKKVYWSRPYIGSGMAVLMETDNGIGVDIGDRRINANAIQTHNTPIPSPSLPPPHHHLRQNKFWLQMWNCMYQQYHYVDWADQADWQSSAFPTLLLSVREQKKALHCFLFGQDFPVNPDSISYLGARVFCREPISFESDCIDSHWGGEGAISSKWVRDFGARDPTVGWGPSI